MSFGGRSAYVVPKGDSFRVHYTFGDAWMSQVFASRRAAFDFAAQVREGRAA